MSPGFFDYLSIIAHSNERESALHTYGDATEMIIRDAVATIILIGLGLWTFMASLYAPVLVSALNHWLGSIILPLLLVALLYGAFRLGMYHALEVPWYLLTIALAGLGASTAGLWYLQGPGVGIPLLLTLIAYAAAGDHFKDGELREQEDEEDSNGGYPS